MKREGPALALALFVLLCTHRAAASELDALRQELRSLRAIVEAQQKTIDALARQRQQQPQAAAPVQAATASPSSAGESEEDLVADVVSTVVEQMHKTTEVHLYGTLDYQDFTNDVATFDADNIELLLNTAPHPAVRLGAEIEFEGTAKTSDGPRQGEVGVEQGWMELGLHEALNLRGGVIVVPFGYYNLNHFEPFQEFVDRPLMARRVVPTTWAEAGVGLTGRARLPRDVSLRYQTYLVNGLTDRITDTSIGDARGAFRTDNNDNKAVVGRAEFAWHDGKRLGLSGYYGEYNRAGRSIAGLDADWSAFRGPFELRGEYAYFGLEEGLTATGESAPTTLQGFYTELLYRFWPSLLRDTWLDKRFRSSRLVAGLRWGFAEIEDDGDAGSGDNREQRFSFAFTYRPLPTFALKLEYQINDTRREALEHGNAEGFLTSLTAAF